MSGKFEQNNSKITKVISLLVSQPNVFCGPITPITFNAGFILQQDGAPAPYCFSRARLAQFKLSWFH